MVQEQTTTFQTTRTINNGVNNNNKNNNNNGGGDDDIGDGFSKTRQIISSSKKNFNFDIVGKVTLEILRHDMENDNKLWRSLLKTPIRKIIPIQKLKSNVK